MQIVCSISIQKFIKKQRSVANTQNLNIDINKLRKSYMNNNYTDSLYLPPPLAAPFWFGKCHEFHL